MTAIVIRSKIDHRPESQQGRIARVMEMLASWRNRAAQRRMVAGLSEYQLHDIGLSRSRGFCEIEKPFWRV